jgi:hypothetical protein
LNIKLHSSRLAGVVMLLTHLAALFIFFWIELAIGIKLLLCLLVLTSLVNVFRRVVLRIADNAITAIALDRDNNMKLIFRNGRQSRVSRFNSIFVNSIVTLLAVAIEDKHFPQNLVIPFDAIEEEDFRQLRVRLKRL